MLIIKMNWDKKARSINLRPQSARPVKTEERSASYEKKRENHCSVRTTEP